MPTRRMLLLGGAFTAVVAAVTPFKVVIDADGLLQIASPTAAAQESGSSGNGGGNGGSGSSAGNGAGSSGGNSSGSGSSNGGGNSNSEGAGAGSGNGSGAGTGGTGGTDTDGSDAGGAGTDGTDAGGAGTGNAGSGASGNGSDPEAGSDTGTDADADPDADTGAEAGKGSPDETGKGSVSRSTGPSLRGRPAARAAPDVEVDTRGSSITVRHRNGTTERISQGRYEMRDSRSRTIVNRTATPSDASRLRSFGR
ncbi:hypothetical protein [Neorhizobium sp. DT-125]|uniref:hypothetical protein n=1 Tax=Neorhizobium sp. DT-125 TaxID=3396163 RepID=UPI003F1B4463